MVSLAASPVPLHLARDTRFGRPLHRDTDMIRVHHGVYAPRDEWESLEPWRRYLSRVHAVRLARPGSVFCLESAAAIVGLPVFGEPRQVHVLGAPDLDGHSYASGGVAVHRFRAGRSSDESDGIRYVSIAETLLDLGRLLPPAFGVAVADAALRTATQSVTTKSLRELASLHKTPRGARRLEWVLDNADAASESPGESVSRAVIDWLGYPPPELQKWFHLEGFDDRSDFYWPDSDVIGESDGYGKYDADDEEAMKQHFIDEKIREDRLRRHVKGFARWDYGDVMQPRRLDAKLRSAGLRPVTHPNERMLSTLRNNPRSF